MIEENGRVIRTQGELAWVETSRSSSCGSCSARGACGTGVLANVLGARVHQVEVLNPIAAEVGDEVVVGISESTLVRGSALLYLLPLLTLFGGAVLASVMAEQWMLEWGELPAVLGGLTGLWAGFYALQQYTRKQSGSACQATLLRRRAGLSRPVKFTPNTTQDEWT